MLEEPLETRFIQSFKSYAASPLFQDTRILGRRFGFEDLLSAFLLRCCAHAPGARPGAPTTAIVGRPVEFAGAQPDPALALARYQTAFARLGFSDIRYAYEPVAAAFFFARKLNGRRHGAGGRLRRRHQRLLHRPLPPRGRRGRAPRPWPTPASAVAGDAFDYRIIDHLVSPELGKGSSYRTFDNVLPIPNRYYAAFARWEQLALLRASRDMRDIRGLGRTALEPEKIARLVEILDDNHGYRLYQAVSRLKEALSAHRGGGVPLRGRLGAHRRRRARGREFEAWIAPELAAIERAVDEALERAPAWRRPIIDRVFLTGGSSFVPAVRRLFARRFGGPSSRAGRSWSRSPRAWPTWACEADLDVWSQRRRLRRRPDRRFDAA